MCYPGEVRRADCRCGRNASLEDPHAKTGALAAYRCPRHAKRREVHALPKTGTGRLIVRKAPVGADGDGREQIAVLPADRSTRVVQALFVAFGAVFLVGPPSLAAQGGAGLTNGGYLLFLIAAASMFGIAAVLQASAASTHVRILPDRVVLRQGIHERVIRLSEPVSIARVSDWDLAGGEGGGGIHGLAVLSRDHCQLVLLNHAAKYVDSLGTWLMDVTELREPTSDELLAYLQCGAIKGRYRWRAGSTDRPRIF